MPTDYSTWLTKQQAADAIGCSTKTIEQFAKERKIQQASWKRPETGARLSVYHPGDVERVRKERNPDAPPFVLPPERDSQNSQSAGKALTTTRQNDSQNSQNPVAILANVFERISSQNSENRWPPPLYLTTDEAVRYSGLSAAYLQRLVAEGKLKRISEGLRGHRYRRADLDTLNL
jgi:hypothetical protein